MSVTVNKTIVLSALPANRIALDAAPVRGALLTLTAALEG